MKARLEVYIRSYGISADVESYHYARQHTYCAPGMLEQALRMPGFRGRILERDSLELLPDLEAAQKRWGRHIRAYDLGRLGGRLKALAAGVWKTPAVVVGGRKHVGLAAAREALRGLGEEVAQPEGRTKAAE